MLCTIDDILAIPGMSNQAARPTAWLNKLIGAADQQIKDWCKQGLEAGYYTDYYDGTTVRAITCRQAPVWLGMTTLAASMNGLTLPQATINVLTTAGFHPGLAGGTATLANPAPGISVQTGLTTYAYVTYTGTTATSFTGCTGGTGTLSGSANNAVFSPVVWWDPGAYSGQAPNAFAQNTQMVLGTQYMLDMDNGATRQLSVRGLIKRIGGAGQGFIGFYPENFYSGKLGAYRLPTWNRGDKNVKVSYTAGWPLYSPELRTLNYACAMLVAQMVRIQPAGTDLSSESMGNYSYSAKQAFDTPEFGEIRRALAPYREVSLGND